jgi:hypothetical protein
VSPHHLRWFVLPLALAGAVLACSPAAAQTAASAERDALVREIHLRLLALRDQPGDPTRRAVEISRCELYLAALEALAREEQVRAAALRHGARAQVQLQQTGAAVRQMTSSLERSIAP